MGTVAVEMSDEEYAEDESVSNTSKKGDGNFRKARGEAKKVELDEQLKEYINEWRKQRAEQEEKLAQQKKEEEERLRKEEAEKKALEADEKRKKLEEAEKKRQEMMKAQKEKMGP